MLAIRLLTGDFYKAIEIICRFCNKKRIMTKNILLMADPQVNFSSGKSPVPGATEGKLVAGLLIILLRQDMHR